MRGAARLQTIAVLSGAAVLAAACGRGGATPDKRSAVKPRDAATADADPDKLEAAALFATFCAHCHGADAKGYKADHAPSLVNPTFLASATDDYLTRSIVQGRPGTSMAGYGKERGGPLSAEPIARIVAWLRAQGPPAKALMATGVGDAQRGGPIYAASCQKCHGTATTRGEFVHLANAQFLQVATDSFIKYAIVEGRPGTQMEPFGKKLSEQDILDVLAFVRGLGTAPEVGQLPPPTGKEPIFINPDGKPPAWKNLKADPCPPNVKCANKPRYVAADDVKKALDEHRKLVIIDARPQSDWMRVHITGAVSIPHHDLERLDEIPKDAWVIAYCACPHHLSGIVADELDRRGYPHALVLDEGILEWHRRGYTVVAAPGVTAPPKEPVMAPGTIP